MSLVKNAMASNSSDYDSVYCAPESLKILSSKVMFSKGNRMLHQFVLDNSYPNVSGSENYINAVLYSMPDISVNALNYAGHSALHLAVLKNNILMVKKFLSCFKTLDVNIKNTDGNTALHLATKAGLIPIMHELLKNGADMNVRDGHSITPLGRAVMKDNIKMVKMLLENGCIVNVEGWRGVPLLYMASLTSSTAIVRILLKHGANVNAIDWFGNTAIHGAVCNNRPDIVRELLKEEGILIDLGDKSDNTPLLKAIAANNLEIAQLLLDNGADINGTHTFVNQYHLALRKRNADTLKKIGNDVLATDVNNCSPLQKAYNQWGVNSDIFKLLLDNAADVNAKCKFGHTLNIR